MDLALLPYMRQTSWQKSFPCQKFQINFFKTSFLNIKGKSRSPDPLGNPSHENKIIGQPNRGKCSKNTEGETKENNTKKKKNLFRWVGTLHQAANVLELQLQCQFFQRIFRVDSFRVDCFDLLAVQDSQESSSAPQFGIIKSSVLSLLYGTTFTSVHDYWKNHSFDYMDLCWQSDVSTF